MKLRIRDNSIRLRLTRSEVDTVRATGVLRAAVRFPGGNAFHYAFESMPAGVTPTAVYSDGELLVRVPESTIEAWADSDEVSITGEQAIDPTEVLRILVEKDFACLSPREGEDETDMFEHPEAGRQSC